MVSNGEYHNLPFQFLIKAFTHNLTYLYALITKSIIIISKLLERT
jgi:hypothetical protein